MQIKTALPSLLFLSSFWFVLESKPNIFVILTICAVNVVISWFIARSTHTNTLKICLFVLLHGVATFFIPNYHLAFLWVLLGAFLIPVFYNQHQNPSLEHSWLKLVLFSLSYILFSSKYYFDWSFFAPVIGYVFIYLSLLPALYSLNSNRVLKYSVCAILAMTITELLFCIGFLPGVSVILALIFTGVAASLFQVVHFYLLHELSFKRLKYQVIINTLFILIGCIAGKWTL